MSFLPENRDFRQSMPFEPEDLHPGRIHSDGDRAIDPQSSEALDPFFMAMALEEARRAGEEGEVPVGAVLVAAGKMVACGHNRPIGLADPTAHAEIAALRAGARATGNYRLPETTLYVTLEPCIMCAGALIQARVKRLVFGAEDPKNGGVRSLYSLLSDERLNHRVEIRGGVLLEECREILRRFFQERR
jgi:tRNA(adenine34) deaminase